MFLSKKKMFLYDSKYKLSSRTLFLRYNNVQQMMTNVGNMTKIFNGEKWKR